MDPIETNKIYKEKQKQEKILKKMEDDRLKSYSKMCSKRDDYREWLSSKAHEKIEAVYSIKKSKDIAKKKKKLLIKRNKKINNQKRLIKGHKQVEYKVKWDSWSKLFEKRLKLIQKRRKLEEADENWYCECFTCDAIRKRSSMHWWHWCIRLRKSIAFHDDRINPQCPTCNMPESHGWKWGNYIEYMKSYDNIHWVWSYDKKKLEWLKLIDKQKYNIEFIESRIEKEKIIIKWLLEALEINRQ